LLAWWLYFQRAAKITEEVASTVAAKSAPLKLVENKMNAAKSEIKKLEDQAAPFIQAVRERDYWTTIMADINSRLPPEYIWITNFGPEQKTAENVPAQPKPGQKPEPVRLMITGLYADNPRGPEVVDEFVKNLKESPYYEIKDTEMQRTMADQFSWGWPYSFPLVLKDPIKLPQRTAP
jgi:hypothetical protein